MINPRHVRAQFAFLSGILTVTAVMLMATKQYLIGLAALLVSILLFAFAWRR